MTFWIKFLSFFLKIFFGTFETKNEITPLPQRTPFEIKTVRIVEFFLEKILSNFPRGCKRSSQRACPMFSPSGFDPNFHRATIANRTSISFLPIQNYLKNTFKIEVNVIFLEIKYVTGLKISVVELSKWRLSTMSMKF